MMKRVYFSRPTPKTRDPKQRRFFRPRAAAGNRLEPPTMRRKVEKVMMVKDGEGVNWSQIKVSDVFF